MEKIRPCPQSSLAVDFCPHLRRRSKREIPGTILNYNSSRMSGYAIVHVNIERPYTVRPPSYVCAQLCSVSCDFFSELKTHLKQINPKWGQHLCFFTDRSSARWLWRAICSLCIRHWTNWNTICKYHCSQTSDARDSEPLGLWAMLQWFSELSLNFPSGWCNPTKYCSNVYTFILKSILQHNDNTKNNLSTTLAINCLSLFSFS